MKQLKKLKLSELSKKELEKRQMKTLKGGDYCDNLCGTLTPDRTGQSQWRGYYY